MSGRRDSNQRPPEPPSGVAAIRQGAAALRAKGAALYRTVIPILLAESLAQEEQAEEAGCLGRGSRRGSTGGGAFLGSRAASSPGGVTSHARRSRAVRAGRGGSAFPSGPRRGPPAAGEIPGIASGETPE